MIKKFTFDPNKSWEENYKALEAHHIEETTDLFDKLSKVRKQLAMGKVALVDADGEITGAQG